MKNFLQFSGNGDGTYIGNDVLTTVTKNKQWISLHSKVSGKIYVDPGAEKALVSNGSSLLPAGIYDIKGVFNKGDVVEVFGANGLLGQGRGSIFRSGIKTGDGQTNNGACTNFH